MDAFNAADFNMALSVMGKNRTVQHSHNLKYELSKRIISFFLGNNHWKQQKGVNNPFM